MKDIVQREDPVLHIKAALVPIEEIGSEKINRIIKDMQIAMSQQKDGVAIAAPQIGVSLQIFVVNGELLRHADKTFKGDGTDLVFINPVIVKVSKEKKDVEEGCLSVRWLYGSIKRAARVSIKAYDEKGAKVARGASGLLAQIFQHEIDHLNGILFTDNAKQIWEMTAEEIAEIQRK